MSEATGRLGFTVLVQYIGAGLYVIVYRFSTPLVDFGIVPGEGKGTAGGGAATVR